MASGARKSFGPVRATSPGGGCPPSDAGDAWNSVPSTAVATVVGVVAVPAAAVVLVGAGLDGMVVVTPMAGEIGLALKVIGDCACWPVAFPKAITHVAPAALRAGVGGQG